MGVVEEVLVAVREGESDGVGVAVGVALGIRVDEGVDVLVGVATAVGEYVGVAVTNMMGANSSNPAMARPNTVR